MLDLFVLYSRWMIHWSVAILSKYNMSSGFVVIEGYQTTRMGSLYFVKNINNVFHIVFIHETKENDLCVSLCV